MLRSFRVQNHKSIRGEAELLLMPAYDKQRPVVPVAAVFGANASGKSNLFDALRFMQTAVRTSFSAWEPGTGVPRTPFRLDPAAQVAPSLYAVELLLDGVRHMYGFVVGDDKVREEWLYAYPTGRKRVVFERDAGGWKFGTGVPKAKADLVRELTPDNVLFLSVAARSDLEEAAPVYGWFQQHLIFEAPSAESRLRDVIFFVESSSQNRQRLIGLLQAADLGIVELQTTHHIDRLLRTQLDAVDDRIETLAGVCRLSNQAEDDVVEAHEELKELLELRAEIKAEIDSHAQRELHFVHGDNGVLMTQDDESRGTIAWLRLLMPTFAALDTGSALCVDEIDSSLHPRLTARLIELFRNAETNPLGAQLLFTTHDATLLGTSFGEEILERDQVWFVEKDAAGATKLFPLTDFQPRKGENRERRYLGGSYGAVPAVFSDTLVEQYLAARREPTDAAS